MKSLLQEPLKLICYLFGRDSNVGTAKIGLDIVNSQEWQAKREKKVKEFAKTGIVLNSEEETK